MIHNISIATADDVTYFGDDVKYIPCIFTQGYYHFGMLSQLVRKDYCFRPIFRSICCKLIWELTYGHCMYISYIAYNAHLPDKTIQSVARKNVATKHILHIAHLPDWQYD